MVERRGDVAGLVELDARLEILPQERDGLGQKFAVEPFQPQHSVGRDVAQPKAGSLAHAAQRDRTLAGAKIPSKLFGNAEFFGDLLIAESGITEGDRFALLGRQLGQPLAVATVR